MNDAKIVKITWIQTLKIWWAWFWRTILGLLVTSGGFGFVIGLVRDAVHDNDNFSKRVLLPVVFVAWFVWWIVGLRMALRKRYGDFHIVLVHDKSEESSTSPVLPPVPTSTNKHLDALDRLAKLRDTGALTDAEFEAAKKSILNDLGALAFQTGIPSKARP
jgi:hypothetical protein